MTCHLPIGVDDFPVLRANPEFLYIDKTERIAAMLGHSPGRHPHLFLARPRRFGKTLLLSTLQALFQGRRALFADTWIGQPGNWDWAQRQCPVLRLNMGIRGIHDPRALRDDLQDYMLDLIRQEDVSIVPASHPGRMLTHLIRGLFQKHDRPVAVLVDEYDTPITENIDRPHVLEGILDIMRAFYGALKDSTPYIQCTFMTGITRFARAGLFSGANHLEDLSFSPRCHALLGFTDAEIASSPDLRTDMDQCAVALGCTPAAFRQALQAYYNGYWFSPRGVAVYNPFSLAQCLKTLREDGPGTLWTLTDLPHAWAESGTPDMLFRLWRPGEYHAADMEAVRHNRPLAVLRRAHYDTAHPDLSALMYHTGYLTLTPPTTDTGAHAAPGLDFPNREVRLTFMDSLQGWQKDRVWEWYRQARDPAGLVAAWTQAWQTTQDPTRLSHCIDTLMHRIPYPLHHMSPRTRELYDYEVHYQIILYTACQAMGLPVQAEVHTARGRIDLVIAWDHHIALIECKVGMTADDALTQVWAQGYAEMYRQDDKPITVWGLQFKPHRRTTHAVAAWSLGRYDQEARRWQHEPCRVPLAELMHLPASERKRILREKQRNDDGGAHTVRLV